MTNSKVFVEVSPNTIPTVTGTGRSVAEIVTAVHRVPVDEGLAALGLPAVTRATLEPILIYCAEQRCVADSAACPGCRRSTLLQGLQTFDDFVARHAVIESADGRTRLTGAGTEQLVVSSLEELSKTWAGEELWFQARRVLRKHRFGIRNTDGKRPDGLVTTPSPAASEPTAR